MANKKLPELLGERVDVENLEISIFGNNVLFNNPSIEVDSAGNDAHIRIDSKAKSISIEGFSFWDLIVSNKIGVDKLTIDSTYIHVELPEVKPSTSSKKEINLFVKEIFTSIVVSKLELTNADILVTKKGTTDTLLIVDGFRLDAEEIVVDTATVNDIFPLEFDKSELSIDHYRIRAGELYTFSGANFVIKDTTVSIQDLRFKSIYDKGEFAKQQEVEKARIDLEIAKFNSKKILWDLDSSGFSIHATKLNLEEARLIVYKDKRPTKQPQDIKPLLTGMIRNIPFSLIVDTVTVKNSFIQYEQFPVMFPRSGKVFFDNMYVTAYNITNDSARISKLSNTIFDVQTDFMGEGKLNVQIKLDLASARQDFSVKGKLGTLPVTYVNQVMTPLVGVTAEGTVHELTFSFGGDEYDASGMLFCEYSNLKISKYDNERDKEFIKTLFGNLVLRNNNEEGGSEGEIYFIRYQNKDFFNFLWNSVRTGLMDIAVPFYKNPDKSGSDGTPKFKEDKPLPK